MPGWTLVQLDHRERVRYLERGLDENGRGDKGKPKDLPARVNQNMPLAETLPRYRATFDRVQKKKAR